MSSSNLSVEQKKANKDLNIIIIATLVALAIVMVFNNQFVSLIKNTEISLLLRTTIAALMQFGVAGLGITVVTIYRKESFISYGLNRENLVKSILLSIMVFIPYLIFLFVTNSLTSYFPFQSVYTTKEWLALGFPKNIVGMAITAIAWGFFEGFNYVIINDKLNKLLPSKNRWLNWGAAICGIVCLLIHGMVGVTPSAIIEAITVFIIIYGMLIVKEYTGNAWGCVFIFVFLWNAF